MIFILKNNFLIVLKEVFIFQSSHQNDQRSKWS